MAYTTTETHALGWSSSETSTDVTLTGSLKIVVKDENGNAVYTSPEISLGASGVGVPMDGTETVILPQRTGTVGTGRDAKNWNWAAKATYHAATTSQAAYVSVEDVVNYDGSGANASFTLNLVTLW